MPTDDTPQLTGEDAELVAEATARFELLRRQDRELDGKDIALIRGWCGVQMAKCVVNLKDASEWAAEYGDRLATRVSALSAELEGAREVLEPFVSAWDEATAKYQQAGDAWTSEEARSHLSADDFRRAAALLPNPAPAGRGE